VKDSHRGSGSVARLPVKARQFAGLAILLLVGLIIVAIKLWPSSDPVPQVSSISTATVNGIIGGKAAFLHDPDVIKILNEKYGLTVNFTTVGSIEQIDRCAAGLDFCWPSSQTAGELIQRKFASNPVKSEIIFNSPIVLYTWAPIADALIAQGIVEKTGDAYYVVNFARLIQMIGNGVAWKDIGLPQLYGKVIVFSSDPTHSNTGNSFAGLLANTLNNGQVVDGSSAAAVLPQVEAIFARMGLLPNTTTQLFEQFLALGMGAAPIIVAYESNLIEYGLTHQTPTDQAIIGQQVRTLYPKPTVWSSQPLIALTAGGEHLMAALRDPEIQRLGWEHHGFRSAVSGVPNNPNAVGQQGVPASIDSVIQMPRAAVMELIITALQATPTAAFRQAEAPPDDIATPPKLQLGEPPQSARDPVVARRPPTRAL
jgi:hypothetical protein